jgi:hypothetical protein
LASLVSAFMLLLVVLAGLDFSAAVLVFLTELWCFAARLFAFASSSAARLDRGWSSS